MLLRISLRKKKKRYQWPHFFFNRYDPFAIFTRLNTKWGEERAKRAGVPPASNWRGFVGFALPPESRCPLLVTSLFLTLLPVQLSSLHLFSLSLFRAWTYSRASLSFSNVPPSSPPPPSSTLTFQLRVPALPRSHSARFSSPPTVHRFNHEYLLPSRGIRTVLLASFDSSYNFPSFSLYLPAPPFDLLRFFSIFGSYRFLAPFFVIVVSLLFPLSYPTRSAFLFLRLSVSLGEASYPRSSVRLCPDTNLNLFFFLSLSIFLSFSFSTDVLGGGSLLSLFTAVVFARSNPRLLSAATAITWFQHWSLSLSPPLPPHASSTRASKSVRDTHNVRTRAHSHVYIGVHIAISRSRIVFRLSADPTIVFVFLTIINPTLLPEYSTTPRGIFHREKKARWSREKRSLNNGKLDGFQ